MELKKLSVLVAVMLASPVAISAEVSQSDIDGLQKQINKINQNNQLADWITRFNVSGFATLGVGLAKDGAGYAGYDDDELNFTSDSLLALQTDYYINDHMEATLQIITRGEDDWDVDAEWAFVSYEFSNDFTVRAGKLRAPLFMLSDYQDVGYALPFARPSEEIYAFVPATNYTGVEFLYDIEIGNSVLELHPIYGESTVDADDTVLNTEYELKNLYGIASTLEFDEIAFRGSYFASTSHVNWEDGETYEYDVEFFGAGFRYDNGSLMLMGEYTIVEVDEAYPDTDSYYVGAAYRIGRFTPYVMYSNIESQDNEVRADQIAQLAPLGITGRSGLDVERTSYSAGVRWDFTVGAALKFDVTYADDFGDTSGGLYNTNVNNLEVPGLGNVPLVNQQYDDALVFSILLDLAF